MRFSDIQKDPRNYDTDILVGKLENYFTTTIENCPFVDLLSETVLHLTLTDETVEPVTIPIHVKHDKGQTTAHVPNQHVVAMLTSKKPDDKLTLNKLAYRQKARAFAQELSPLEKNMTPTDLYKAGNPAWAQGLSINQLRNINAYYRTAEEENVLDKFEQHFGELLASSHDYWAGKEVFQSLVLGNK